MNQHLQNIQKSTGIKQGKYDNEKNMLYHQSKTFLKMLDLYVQKIEETKMTDEQFFIDFLDSLNEISVRY